LILAFLALCGGWSTKARADLVEESVEAGGTSRTYLLAVPTSYKAGQPTPLVLIFHGQKTGAQYAADSSEMHVLGERSGFIVAYPQGLKNSWNSGGTRGENWAEKNNIDDVGFVRALVASVSKRYTIDQRRVFAAGISNGGRMSYRLACEASDLFAAIASVAGPLTDESCRPSQPVSILHIHGTKDWINPYEGGRSLGRQVPSSDQGLQFWAQQDGCKQRRQARGEGSWEYDDCAGGRRVQLLMVPGGKHRWNQPGIDTSSEIWRFFSANARK
jgi:polyhydroxybutyrate depolymerase